MPKVVVAGTGEIFEVADDDTILRAALRSGLGMSYSCNSGCCGNCRFELVGGAVEHVRNDAPAWTDRDRKRNRWLGCQSRALSDCEIKVRLDSSYESAFRLVSMTGRLAGVGALTHDMSEFAFALPVGFRPGQYGLLTLPGVGGPARLFDVQPAGRGGLALPDQARSPSLTRPTAGKARPGSPTRLWGHSTANASPTSKSTSPARRQWPRPCKSNCTAWASSAIGCISTSSIKIGMRTGRRAT
jgi:ferredoxin